MATPIDDDEDLELPDPVRGSLELGQADHDAHPAGWLYVPDLTSETGWSVHSVPTMTRAGEPRRMGFRP